MRIALMTNNYKPFLGGVPISVERLAKGLEEMGHQVTVFAPTYEGQTEEENVFRYATCRKRCIGGTVLPNPFDRRIEREFQKKHFDIIHVHHPMLIGRTAVYLSKKYGILDFLNGSADRKKLEANAAECALEYREEAVAKKAVRLYNKVIAVKNITKIKTDGDEQSEWKHRRKISYSGG